MNEEYSKKVWKVVDVKSVQDKTKLIFADADKGKTLESLYLKLKTKLEKFPPDEMLYSPPKEDLFGGSLIYWVKSENLKILIRAVYFLPSGNCVIDRFHLSDEGVIDIDL